MTEAEINDVAATLADTLAAAGIAQFSISRNQIGLNIAVIQTTTLRGVEVPSQRNWTIQPYNPPAPQ